MSAAAKISARLDGRTVLVVGRAGMDLYPLPDGSTIEAATGFVSDVGGSAGNIAVALARLGGKAALLSAFSDDWPLCHEQPSALWRRYSALPYPDRA